MISSGARTRPSNFSSSTDEARHPRPVADPEVAGLRALLWIEKEARDASTENELAFLIANETRRIVKARQIFVFDRTSDVSFAVKAVSSMAAVDRDAPLLQWIERVASHIVARAVDDAVNTISLQTFAEDGETLATTYPFPEALWIPLRSRDGSVFAALMVVRETAWDEPSIAVLERLGTTYAHAWAALVRPAFLKFRLTNKRRIAAYVAGGLALLGLVPLPLSALAPAEVVAANPQVIAAALDGVIGTVEVEPNASVKAGQVLFRFVDTSLRDNARIADKAVGVAEAKWKQYAQGAFVDPTVKRELSTSEAEYELKKAERDYAVDLLSRTVVLAPKDGIVVFNDKRDLVGRPVSMGQRLMEIADPNDVRLRINVAVDDSIVLREGGPVRAFLDNDPLRAVEARITRASHGARVIEGNQLVFRADAAFVDTAADPARLGIRGTAQLYGDRTPIIFMLLRRPLSYLRQHVGL